MGKNRFCQRPMLWWEIESWPTKSGELEKKVKNPWIRLTYKCVRNMGFNCISSLWERQGNQNPL